MANAWVKLVVAMASATVASSCAAQDTVVKSSTSPSSASTSASTSGATKSESLETPSAAGLPTAAEVNGWVKKALDASAALGERNGLFADVAADPSFADTFASGAKKHQMTIEVRAVRAFAGGASADGVITLDGFKLPDGGSILLARSGENWRISKQWACAMLPTLGQSSPAC